ncbi:hypothetical protein ACRTDP_20810 [Vibrio alginolyticus]|uniref:hypothetical protein n=1 Tax=Gammaproteobacteria TaxID=1236 RepID=UPI00147D71B5|nr:MULTISPECIES: hypothetical protein [Gammaproteobacteria]ELB2848802.1 hypothetical protein [Vibrio alginolyticus]MCR9330075.1 hypothetical protein [Vibrio alginolyticus]MDW3169268.1 hypothetical protein [Vibrio sp. Y184]URQ94269.1 hypothetical protein J4N40_16235 [Vibrio sp. SCSIO 43097]
MLVILLSLNTLPPTSIQEFSIIGGPLTGFISPHQWGDLESEMKSGVSGINSAPACPAWYIPGLDMPDGEPSTTEMCLCPANLLPLLGLP